MAQEESRKISERVLAGQKISRQKGVLYGSGNIIGYDRDNAKRTYVINEEQAATIRMVFTLYSQGYGEKAIVNELSRQPHSSQRNVYGLYLLQQVQSQQLSGEEAHQ